MLTAWQTMVVAACAKHTMVQFVNLQFLKLAFKFQAEASSAATGSAAGLAQNSRGSHGSVAG